MRDTETIRMYRSNLFLQKEDLAVTTKMIEYTVEHQRIFICYSIRSILYFIIVLYYEYNIYILLDEVETTPIVSR